MRTDTIGSLILGLCCGVVGGYMLAALVPRANLGMGAHHSSSMSTTMHSMTSALSGKTGDELDRAFLSEMIVHHEGAVEMARLVSASSRDELREFASRIETVQVDEIAQMRAWQRAWFSDTPQSN